jgi:hypothetical protein
MRVKKQGKRRQSLPQAGRPPRGARRGNRSIYPVEFKLKAVKLRYE